MTDAEQFLADLEAKAKAATLEEWREGTVILSDGSIVSAVVTVDGDEICSTGQRLLHDGFDAAYIAAANPAAVLRLVGMARFNEITPLRIRREYDEMRELNCPWCRGSGHIDDCKQADQAVKRRLEQLEKEADWLATAAANGGWHGVRVSPKQMRDAARKACKEQK